MAGDRSPRATWRWWAIGVALTAAAVLIRAIVPAQGFDRQPETLVGVGVGLAIVVLLVWLTPVVYHHGESRLRARTGPSAWVHRAIDPDDPQAWLSVVVSDEAVTVLGRRNRVRSRWPLEDIVGVDVTPVRIGLLDHTGLTITLRDGSRGRIALPSRSTFSYPEELTEEAQQEIRRRLATRRRG